MKPLCEDHPAQRARTAIFGLLIGFGFAFGGAGMSSAQAEKGVEDRIAAHAAHGELTTRIAPDPVSTAESRVPPTAQDLTVNEMSGQAAQAQPDTPFTKDPAWREPRQACINVRLLRDFQVIDEEHAVFFESARRPYLVSFAGFCPELRFAVRIKTASRTGRLCGGAGERIFVGRFRCFVRTIERVSSPDHARYLVAERTRARQTSEAPQAAKTRETRL
ncbi:MAG: DUF6491 family protein [Alphaproteobacteria bacterium]